MSFLIKCRQTLSRHRVRVRCCSCMQVWSACGGTAYGNVVLPPGCGLLTSCAAEKKDENSDEAENACTAYGCACGHVVTPVELPFCGWPPVGVAISLCAFEVKDYTKMFPCAGLPPPGVPLGVHYLLHPERGGGPFFRRGAGGKGSTCTPYRLRSLGIFHIIDDALDGMRLAGHFRNGV